MKTISPLTASPIIFLARGLLGIACLLTLSSLRAYAHHPFEGQEGGFSLAQGFLSGLAHPLIGFDHFLFLLSIGMTGLVSSLRWIPCLLGFGMVGSLLAFVIPSIPGSELVMGLSLVASALVALGRLRPVWMIPLISSHGYVLAAVMIGSEPTPLAGYFLGLLIAEALVISTGILFTRKLLDQKVLFAGALIGIGISMAYGNLLS